MRRFLRITAVLLGTALLLTSCHFHGHGHRGHHGGGHHHGFHWCD